MSSAKDPKTDRELLLTVVSRLDAVSDSMQRIAASLEKLENSKIASLEKMLFRHEKWINEWGGALKLATVGLIIAQVVSLVSKWI